MKNIFTSKQNAQVRPHELLVRSHKAATYRGESLKILEPKIWNVLSTKIKCETLIGKIKK